MFSTMIICLRKVFKKLNSSDEIIKNHQRNFTTKIQPLQQNGETCHTNNSVDRHDSIPDLFSLSRTENGTVSNQEMKSGEQFGEKKFDNSKDKRLSIIDNHSKVPFVINTGSERSLYPKSLVPNPIEPAQDEFLSPQSTNKKFATTSIKLDLSLGHDLEWDFIIADVSQPILGADFLSHYGIIVNLKKKIISLDHDSELSINSRLPFNVVPNKQNEELRKNDNNSNVDDSRVFVTDQNFGFRFLVDSGTQENVFPRSMLQDQNLKRDPSCHLQQSDKTKIPTYGNMKLNLDFGLNRKFEEKFRVADVNQPILGACFLKNNKLFIDYTNNSLKNLSVWHAHKQKYALLYAAQYILMMFVIFYDHILISIIRVL